MTRKQRLAFLTVSLLTLLAAGRLTLGSFDFVFRDFWFSAGLLLLILLSVVDQPHFSKDSNVFLNGIAGLIALLSVTPRARDSLWVLFFVWSWYLVVTSYAAMLKRSSRLEFESRTLQLVSRINRSIGRPEALFSAFFLWGIFTQFGQNSRPFAALMWFWAIFIILDLRTVSAHLGKWLDQLGAEPPSPIGRISGFVSPRIAEAELTSRAPQDVLGRRVGIVGDRGRRIAIATVIDDRVLAGRRRIRMGIVEQTDKWQQLASERHSSRPIVFVESLNDDDRTGDPITLVDRGSTIGSLVVRVNPGVALEAGDILWTRLPSGIDAFYQIVSASITEDALGGDDALHYITVTASQLGRWLPDRAEFEPVSWVAPAGALVRRVSPAVQIGAVPEGRLRVGGVPNSPFPVHVSLGDVVTHNTAILGVTGSGKSYLCLHLVEGFVQSQIKVLVLDLSRQYWTMLTPLGPSAIRNRAELATWLGGPSALGVYQFADSDNFTLTTAQFVETCFQHFRDNIVLRAGVDEPARLCIVMEEAHSLIPEWNQVATRDDSNNVNRTARTILQGRKYGMGCIVVSQRTANVTKTILNQCNSVFALQCFDQTGLDFLTNYMGTDYARAISDLPTRQAILVGKASSSRRPIRFLIDDFGVRWIAQTPPQANQHNEPDADAG